MALVFQFSAQVDNARTRYPVSIAEKRRRERVRRKNDLNAKTVSTRKSEESRKAVDRAVAGRRSQAKGKVAGLRDDQIRSGSEARGDTGGFKRRSNHGQAQAYLCGVRGI